MLEVDISKLSQSSVPECVPLTADLFHWAEEMLPVVLTIDGAGQ